MIPAIMGLGGVVDMRPRRSFVPVVVSVLAFPAGWVALGVSALRIDGPRPAAIQGAA